MYLMSILMSLCFSGGEEPQELQDFVSTLQELAIPHSNYVPTLAQRQAKVDSLKSLFGQHAQAVPLVEVSTVLEVTWTDGVATIKIARVLDRWKKTRRDAPLSFNETEEIDLVMTKEQSTLIKPMDRITINANALMQSNGVSGSGPPHGQFLFSASSKRHSVMVTCYVTRDYEATIGDVGTFKGYWDANSAEKQRVQRVDVNF